MKIAVIGAGKWGKNIIRTLDELSSLGCIIDANPDQRQLYSDAHGVPAFASFEEADKGLFDAVAIATPAEFHEQNALDAIAADKHVFVEKPMTLSSESAQRMIDAANKAGKTLMIGHLLLYQPAVDFIKESIQTGLVGDLRSIHVRRLNLGRARDIENVLWSLGVHDLAVVLGLMPDEPTKVQISGDAFLNQTVEDDTHLHLTFPGGVKAHIHSSWLWPVQERKMIVVGSTGFLVYDETAQTVTHHNKRIDDNLANVDDGAVVVFEGAAKPLTLEMEHFIECCQTGNVPKSDGISALAVTKVMEQASEALA